MLKSINTVQLGIIFSRQLNCTTVFILLQELFAEGGIHMYIFRAYITRKDGTKDYAKNHGKKAFRFWVGSEPKSEKKKQ